MELSISSGFESSPEVLYATFNQDASCVACGTLSGFRIYSVDGFRETFCRDFHNGGIGKIEMLFKCNILALVGGGPNPRFHPNKVVLWDDHLNRCIGELSFRSEVRGVRLRRDRVVVILMERVYVYNFSDLTLRDHLETSRNPDGICALCPLASANVMACPAVQVGHVQVLLYDSGSSHIIPAHSGRIACLALNSEGTLLATASEKGTLIRIFKTINGELVQEVRRGTMEAKIYSMAFSSRDEFLAVSSNKGTVHVFQLLRTVRKSEDSKSISPDNKPKGFLPKYFRSEWSFAQFAVPKEKRTIVAFGNEKNVINIVCEDGFFYRAVFNAENGGTALEESRVRYFRGKDDQESENANF